ncbi:MAG: NfeD family protein, partial [Candidatus Latescibacteria bacterium]|nr:NfeD family protein [Candidatus Latescibacterota bacterium]
VVELFVPGFGVFGLLGAVAITASLFLSMVGRWPTTTPQELLQAATYLGLSVIATFGLLAVTWGILPRVGAFRRLILPEVQLADRGYRGTDASRFEGMVGRQGFAASQLRPTGLGSFDDERIDVVSDSEFIEEGTAIVIAKIEGAKVVVRPV